MDAEFIRHCARKDTLTLVERIRLEAIAEEIKRGENLKKDRIRDYATAAFVDYAANGYITYDEAKKEIYNAALLDAAQDVKNGGKNPVINATKRAEKAVEDKAGYLLDVLAVDKTIEILQEAGKGYIIDVVFNVYDADSINRRNAISSRVKRLAAEMPASEMTIYRYLKQARDIFAKCRGLNG